MFNRRRSSIAGLCFLAATSLAVSAAQKVVNADSVNETISLEIAADEKDGVLGRIHNRSAIEVSDVTVLVRHHWVWPYAGNNQSDARSSVDFVRIAGSLSPGGSTEFHSKPRKPSEAGNGARYFASARVVAFSQIAALCSPACVDKR